MTVTPHRVLPVPEDHFGEHVAERYDESAADMFEPAVVDPVVDFLAELAGDGDALELGIGTGRIALPLAKRGIRVHGIDLSEAMVGRLKAKPGAESVDVTIGDFATTTIEGAFSLAYLVFNTINNLTTQDEQVACFRNVAAHLQPAGCFVIEVGVPDLQRLLPGETFRPLCVSPTNIGFDEYDVVSQGLISHHYRVVEGGLVVLSIPFRYVWPSELDLMAQLAGMTLRERWGGWKREPLTSESTKHVSVWEKPASRACSSAARCRQVVAAARAQPRSTTESRSSRRRRTSTSPSGPTERARASHSATRSRVPSHRASIPIRRKPARRSTT